MEVIVDAKGYLSRMSKPLAEKLKVLKYFPEGGGRAVDVGCADGVVTSAMAMAKPDWIFLGIDLESAFIKEAKSKNVDVKNVNYEKIYLRELLARKDKYNVVSFLSVLHEFYSYGEGVSSVVKALADAHELLIKGGRVIIRDMILPDYVKRSEYGVLQIKKKVRVSKYNPQLVDFEAYWGEIKTLGEMNHFLLKYSYIDNWQRELKEYYTAMSFKQYEQIFELLGMKVLYEESYTIPYLSNKWEDDFKLTPDEIAPLRSTGILVAAKVD